MRRALFRGLCSAAALIAANALIVQAAAEPSAALIAARTHVRDGGVSAVTFRSMSEFFPVEAVGAGRASRLPRRIIDLNPEVMLTSGAVAFEDALDRTFCNALLVIQDGEIVYERYRNGSNAQSRFISFSMAKSITSLLVGEALAEGRIRSLDEPVEAYLPELRGSAFEGASIRNLLLMRHGTNYIEHRADGLGHLDIAKARSLDRNETRFADVRGLGLERAPGAEGTFNYSTLVTGILGRLVERATGERLAPFMERTLWRPAGMEASGYWILDGDLPEGEAFAGGGFNAVLRDYGRLGLLILNDGRALSGRQIIAPEWLAESTRYDGPPVMPGSPRGYQYQWWTTIGTPVVEAIGIHGQYISIDPATNTVIVKLSHDPDIGGREQQLNNAALFNAIRAELAQRR